ncbi:MAG: 5'/3'-nucleotidase SurE [Elusimicrobia bacterium]|nr:5'/3'-nucleotidase SurE [Elusimicrobiota bacterium]
MKNILVTNDDGIYGPGLWPLLKELKKISNVIAVVPERERSGTSHSITLHKPLRVKEIEKNIYIANGSPADCVKYAVRALSKNGIDLVISGINSCPNLGQDIVYSGTVAGAREAAILNIPSFAISVSEEQKGIFKTAANISANLARKIFDSDFPYHIYLNVNIPKNIKGISITSLGRRIYDQKIEARTDPRGKRYYWLSGKYLSGVRKKGTDITAVQNGFISITPLHLDPTARDLFGVFDKWTNDLS